MPRKIRWKTIGWIAGAALVIYLIIGVVRAGFGTPPLPNAENGITLKGGHVQGNRIMTKSWSFDYTSAQLSADGTTGTVDGVRDGIVFKKGKPYLRVAAEHISLDTQSLNFSAIGKVHVEMIGDPQRRSFDTDLVIWSNGAKMLRMDHPSYLHSGAATLKLENVGIDFDTDQVHLGRIAGSVEVSPKP